MGKTVKMKTRGKAFKICFVCAAALFFAAAVLVISVFIENHSIEVSNYNIYSKKLSSVFNGYKIAHISDFHNSENYNKAIEKTKEENPNIIIITGDMINMEDTDFSNALKFAEGLVEIAPVYFASGNHERWCMQEGEFIEKLAAAGVTVVNDRVEKVTYRNNTLNLIGFNDVIYDDTVIRYNVVREYLGLLYDKIEDENAFNILLLHRPNLIDNIDTENIDLIMSGHLHGGEIGIPFIADEIINRRTGGSKYVKGLYTKKHTYISVSGGLENNMSSPRLFNKPQIITITLNSIK